MIIHTQRGNTIITFNTEAKKSFNRVQEQRNREVWIDDYEPLTIAENEDIAFGSLEMYLGDSKEIKARTHRFWRL